MTPDLRRPSLLRSPILWIGLAMMIFLGWAWLDSVKRWPYAAWRQFGLTSQSSGVMLWLLPGQNSGGGGSCGFNTPAAQNTQFPRNAELLVPRLGRPEIGRALQEHEWAAFRKTGEIAGRQPDPAMGICYWWGIPRGIRMVFIPYWCLTLAALLPWLGMIYWRHRRIHRLPLLASPEPEVSHGH